MKYSKTKNKTKKVIIVTLISLVCIAGLISAFAYFKIKKPDLKQVQQQAEQQESTEAKKTTAETETSNTQSGSQEQVDKSSNANTNNGGDTGINTAPTGASVSIDSAIQESNIVNITTSVTGVSSGSCKFNFSAPDGSSLSKTANMADGKCSLTASALEFSYIGKWSVVVNVGDVSSSAKEVNIQ